MTTRSPEETADLLAEARKLLSNIYGGMKSGNISNPVTINPETMKMETAQDKIAAFLQRSGPNAPEPVKEAVS